MASTWAGTAQAEWVTRAAIVDGVAAGDISWRTSQPSGWSGSGRWVTWIELHSAIDLDSGAPGETVHNGGDPETDPDWNRWPAKASLLLYLPEPAPPAPSVAPSGVTLIGFSGGILRASWTNTGGYLIRVVFNCITNPILVPPVVVDPLPQGTTQTQIQITNFDPETFRASVNYYNQSGSGPVATSNDVEWSTQH